MIEFCGFSTKIGKTFGKRLRNSNLRILQWDDLLSNASNQLFYIFLMNKVVKKGLDYRLLSQAGRKLKHLKYFVNHQLFRDKLFLSHFRNQLLWNWVVYLEREWGPWPTSLTLAPLLIVGSLARGLLIPSPPSP